MGARGPRKKFPTLATRPVVPLKERKRKPRKPKHVSADKLASETFDHVVAALDRIGILRQSHEMPIALLATEWSRHVKAAAIARDEPIVEGPRGPKANPAAGVASQAARVALDLLRDFGLTPASLARVEVPDEIDEGDPLAEYIA